MDTQDHAIFRVWIHFIPTSLYLWRGKTFGLSWNQTQVLLLHKQPLWPIEHGSSATKRKVLSLIPTYCLLWVSAVRINLHSLATELSKMSLQGAGLGMLHWMMRKWYLESHSFASSSRYRPLVGKPSFLGRTPRPTWRTGSSPRWGRRCCCRKPHGVVLCQVFRQRQPGYQAQQSLSKRTPITMWPE